MHSTRHRFPLLAVPIALGLAACTGADAPTAPATPAADIGVASAPAPKPDQARFEVRFMTRMIDHHMMAVMTSELCVEKAVHAELAAKCEEIIAAQMAEIELMQGWLVDWYGIEHEPDMTRSMRRTMEKLAALDGAEFEIEFMTMMIGHHAQAVREAQRCLRKAYHEELLDLCHEIIAAQTAEIRLFQGWLCEWYAICREEE